MSAGLFEADEGLLASAAGRLRAHDGLRVVLGGSGSGKTAVCAWLHARPGGPALLDMDARIYGTWFDRWRAGRHPVAQAWLASDPLVWQLAMTPAAYLAFQAALAVEALDLLADELAEGLADDGRGPAVVDGGFGSAEVVARALGIDRVVVLAGPAGVTAAERWTADAGRRAFLDEVGAIESVDDPVGRFLALDEAMTAAMLADAEAAGIAVVRRAAGEPVEATARSVAARLGLPIG